MNKDADIFTHKRYAKIILIHLVVISKDVKNDIPKFVNGSKKKLDVGEKKIVIFFMYLLHVMMVAKLLTK